MDDGCGQIHHPDYTWLIANVDAFAVTPEDEKIVVEAKNCDFPRKGDWGNSFTDIIPCNYMCQVQHYLHVTGLKRADVAAKINGLLKIYTVNYSESIIKMFMPRLDKFWNYHVKKQIPPEPSKLGDVKLIYKNCVDKDVEAEESHLNKIARIKLIDLEMKKLQEERDSLRMPIAQYMGVNTRLVANGGKKLATFTQRKGSGRVLRIF